MLSKDEGEDTISEHITVSSFLRPRLLKDEYTKWQKSATIYSRDFEHFQYNIQCVLLNIEIVRLLNVSTNTFIKLKM
jgi:hypothetical protein